MPSFNTSGTFGAHWWGDVSFSINSQNVGANTSSVHVDLAMRADSSSYSQNATTSYDIRINGGDINSGSRNVTMTGPSSTDLISGDTTVGHDANGNCSGSYGGSFSSGYSGVGSGGGDYGFSLPRLALAPSIASAGADQITPTSVRLGTEVNDYGHGTNASCRFYYAVHGTGIYSSTSDQADVAGLNYFTVTGLTPGVSYDYYAYWYNNNGDNSQTSVQTFNTLAVPGMVMLLGGLM